MKTFVRANMPDEIKYNNKIYKASASLSVIYEIKSRALINKDVIRVEVLPSRLKNKTDLFGRYYRPSVWIYEKVNTNL